MSDHSGEIVSAPVLQNAVAVCVLSFFLVTLGTPCANDAWGTSTGVVSLNVALQRIVAERVLASGDGRMGPSIARAINADPASYCSAVRTMAACLECGDEFAGHVSNSANDAMRQAVRKVFPDIEAGSFVWRCMGGEVYSCYIGASGRACRYAATDNAQIEAITRFCEERPNDPVPDSLNYSASQWKCSGKVPVAERTYPVDEQGYMVDSWRRVPLR